METSTSGAVAHVSKAQETNTSRDSNETTRGHFELPPDKPDENVSSSTKDLFANKKLFNEMNDVALVEKWQGHELKKK